MSNRPLLRTGVLFMSAAFAIGCGAPPAANTTAVNTANTNSATNANTNAVNSNSAAASNEFSEPNSYQGVIRLTFETIGQQPQSKQSLPPIVATVARNGADRMMEFTLPTNEKVQYLEKGDMKYVILPSRKQYAELTADALGFEVRRMMMPEQIVNQLRALPGVTKAGEETLNGRQVIRYTYNREMNTNSQAGTVATDSYFLIDKETGLPVRSETVSQSASGANVQGVSGLRLVTEMTDIKPTPDPNLFNVPTDFAKIDPEQVKAQANILFQAAAAVIGQMINQAKVSPTPAATASPAANR
jgi:hypothetical protein